GNGVGDADELDLDRPQADDLLGADGDQLHVALQSELLEALAHQAQGEGAAVDGDLDPLEEVGDGADVVLVAVGEDQAAEAVAVLDHIIDVGDDGVDAQQFLVREHLSAVDGEYVVSVLKDHHVHADLPQAAQGNDADAL